MDAQERPIVVALDDAEAGLAGPQRPHGRLGLGHHPDDDGVGMVPHDGVGKVVEVVGRRRIEYVEVLFDQRRDEPTGDERVQVADEHPVGHRASLRAGLRPG